MADTVNRINPADYELNTIQRNLANRIDSLASSAGTGTYKDQIFLKPLLQQVRGPGTPFSIKQPALSIAGDPQNTNQNTWVFGTPPTVDKPAVNAFGTIYGQVVTFGDIYQSGSSYQTGDTNTTGNLFAGKTLKIGGTSALNDNVIVSPKSVNGFIIQPGATGPAFYITNLARNVANFILFDTGYLQSVSGATYSDTVQAPSFVSGVGFKEYVPLGFINRTNTANAIRSIEPTGSINMQVDQPMPYPGSIVGISVSMSATIAVSTTVVILRNGVAFCNIVIGSNSANGATQMAKGAFKFNAGDTLGASGVTGSTGTVLGAAQYPAFSIRVAVLVEMGA